METFVKLTYYSLKPNLQKTNLTPCEECRELEFEQNQRLGTAINNCEEVCNEGNEYKTIEDNLEDYEIRNCAININEIHSFSESPKGRVIIEHGIDGFNQLFADNYKEFIKKITPHINLI